MFSSFAGVRFIESVHCADRVQVRFPRSKKRRIRKKWAKRPENWAVRPWPDVIALPDGSFVGHPTTIQQLRRALHAEASRDQHDRPAPGSLLEAMGER